MDVVFYEVFSEEEQELRRLLKKGIEAEFRKMPAHTGLSAKPPAPIICTRTQSVIPKNWAPHLKGILTRSAGYNHLHDYLAHCENDIPCGHLPDYCARTVAEHAIMTMLALLKRLKKQLKHFDTFERDGITGSEIFNRNLTVVGVGNIGSQIVHLAKALGMNVKGVDLVKRDASLEYVPLEDGVAFADVLVCALPLTKETKGLLDYAMLNKMNQGSVIINISRGEITPLRDLSKLLSEGILGGIALDVFEEESLLAASLQKKGGSLSKQDALIRTLKDRDNVIFTPHNAFNTREALIRKSKETCHSLETFINEGVFPYPVPMQALV